MGLASDEKTMTVPFCLYLAVVFFEYYGFFRFVPLINAISLSLLISAGLLVYVLLRKRPKAWLGQKQVVLFLMLLCFTTVGMLYAVVRSYSLNVLKGQVGYFVLLILSAHFLSDARRARVTAWMLVIIHAVLVLENRGKLFAEVREGYMVGAYFMGDGNDFGWSLNVAFPLAVYLFMTALTWAARMPALFSCILLVVGIAGTASRGAALALGSSLMGLFLMSDRKVIGLVIMSLVLSGVILFAPAAYFERLETIGNYSEDTSAAGRLEAWGAAINMALDYPLGVGAGNFNSAYGRFYRSADFFSARWISPHSVYFLTLGEYGFLGLLILLAILFINFFQNRQSRTILVKIKKPPISPLWPMFINISLVAYAVGGMFLGGLNYPHLYMLTALTIGVRLMVDKHITEVTKSS